MNDNPTNADEQYELGRKYRKGDSVSKNLEKARYWFSKAAEKNGEAAENAKKMLVTLDSLH